MRLKNDNLIKKWESLRLEAYLPTPNDRWTIGWGHTHTTKPGMVITRDQAEELFDSDVAWAEDAVNKLVKVKLTQNQFDALVSFVFNIGEGGFKSSTALRRLNAGDYEGAAEAMTWWNKQKTPKGHVVLRGLVRRRAEEKEYFLSDVMASSDEDVSLTPTAVEELKPLTKSKEAVGGAVAATGGLLVGFGGLAPEVQERLVEYLPYALVAVGAYFLINRLYARWSGQR